MITDCGSNMISLHREHSLVVCFAHILHTAIATYFIKTKETDNLILNINRTITDIITFVRMKFNVKENYGFTLKEGGVTRAWRSIYEIYNCVFINYEDIIRLLVDKGKTNLIEGLHKENIEE